MSLSAKLRRTPSRLVSGGFILNSGISKLSADEQTAKALHDMAAGAYPVFEKMPPKAFVKALAAGEIAIGSALLLPIVPAGLAGLALVGFSGGLLGMWWRTPGMHEEGSIRPTQQGVTIAKDVWLLGIGSSLVIGSVVDPAHDKTVELTTGAKVATARRTAKASSGMKVMRARAEARAAKAARKAARKTAKQVYTAKGAAKTAKGAAKSAKGAVTTAKDATHKAFDLVTP
jgi:hypothetical protein